MGASSRHTVKEMAALSSNKVEYSGEELPIPRLGVVCDKELLGEAAVRVDVCVVERLDE